MKLGQIIKLERQRKNMRQDQLASGICSTSYLSKIENGTAIPGEDIEQLLLQRLNIQLDNIHKQISLPTLDRFKQQFRQIINMRDKQAAQSLCQEIRSVLLENKHDPHIMSLLLMETRLMLMTSPMNVEKNLELLVSFRSELLPVQQFHLYIIEGIVAFNENQYSKARYLFTKAEDITQQYKMKEWEVAELHYVLSLAAVLEHQHSIAIPYLEKALAYFNRKILVIRSIDCLIILGNAQKHTKHANKALESFESAKEIMLANKVSNRLGMIEHNIGTCHSLLQNHDQALHHFEESLSIKKQSASQIFTVFALVKEHKKIGNIEQAKKFVQKGIALLDSLADPDKTIFSHHFAVYKALLHDEQDIVITFDSAINYFKSIQSYSRCFVYCNVLAARLTEKNQFKLATTYYQQSFSYHLNHHQIQNWEELV